jgi:hypothetical protein
MAYGINVSRSKVEVPLETELNWIFFEIIILTFCDKIIISDFVSITCFFTSKVPVKCYISLRKFSLFHFNI